MKILAAIILALLILPSAFAQGQTTDPHVYYLQQMVGNLAGNVADLQVQLNEARAQLAEAQKKLAEPKKEEKPNAK